MIPYYKDDLVILYCADNAQVFPLIKRESIDLVLTDPPYNISTTDIHYVENGVGKTQTRDFGKWDVGWTVDMMLSPVHPVLKGGGSVVSFCSDRLLSHYACSKEYKCFGTMVWMKTNPMPKFRPSYVQALEYIVWLVKGNKPVWNGGFATHNVFRYPLCAGKERLKGANGKAAHPTQKPLKLVQDLIRLHSNEGDLLLDCYSGVGTTLVAAKAMNRRCIGVELNEEYCRLAVDRLRQGVLGI